MCGIFGVLFVEEAPCRATLSEKLRKAQASIRHRGPDNQGIYIDPSGVCGLAHQRLSIIDLSENAKQPLLDNLKQNALVFNGEIYNFKELAKNYTSYPFKSKSDSEVLLACLQRESINSIPKLDGMFAFGSFNLKTKSLTVAVDPAGQKPLYTYWDGKCFAFSSEIKAFKAFGLDLGEINKNAFQQYLLFGYIPSELTVYSRVKKLPPASLQEIQLGFGPKKIVQYWQLPRKTRSISYAKAKEELVGLIGSAVEKRLISDVEVGSFLSGGLDSSVVTYEAANKLAPKSLRTFSVGFDTEENYQYDETKYARIVAAKVNSKHTEIRLSPHAHESEEILKHFDEPYADSSAIPTYYLCKNASQKVKVVLSGDGSDEIFGGYNRFRAILLSKNFSKYLKLINWVLPKSSISPRSLSGYIQRFYKALPYPQHERLARWNSYFQAEDFGIVAKENFESLYHTFYKLSEELSDLSLGEKVLHLNFHTYLYGDLLPKIDRMSMAHGLEVRSPFLDKKLIEYSFSLPTEYKFGAFYSKKILKDIYRPILGKEITDRKKHGFSFPLEESVSLKDKFSKSMSVDQMFVFWCANLFLPEQATTFMGKLNIESSIG